MSNTKVPEIGMSFVELVAAMRAAQELYQNGRSLRNLDGMQAYQRAVDLEIERLRKEFDALDAELAKLADEG